MTDRRFLSMVLQGDAVLPLKQHWYLTFLPSAEVSGSTSIDANEGSMPADLESEVSYGIESSSGLFI